MRGTRLCHSFPVKLSLSQKCDDDGTLGACHEVREGKTPGGAYYVGHERMTEDLEQD